MSERSSAYLSGRAPFASRETPAEQAGVGHFGRRMTRGKMQLEDALRRSRATASAVAGLSGGAERGRAERAHEPVQAEPDTVGHCGTVSKLEDLEPGLRLAGVIPGQSVAVIAVQPRGDDASR
jgi:hypothetical protein